ncbi:patatin-like phospholipase family protein [Aeromicrobium sp. P5_D10]
MNTTPSTPQFTTRERALVLGGGGSTGNAWLIGIIAGLFDAGLDVTTADLTIGTSAGSTAVAQIAGAPPSELFTATQEQQAPARSGQRPTGQTTDHLERFRKIIASSEDVADMRRRMGAMALVREAESDGAWQTQWRNIVASRLPSDRWPERPVLITAVDANTGDPVAFDRRSGVDLVDAVAASCAGGGLPYRIGGTPYIDGGYRANAENADLAAGCKRVLVLSPLGGRTLHPLEWGTQLAAQVDALRAGGSQVETVVPDTDAEHMFGANAMDLSLRRPAAQAGYDQGQALADRLTEVFRGSPDRQ